MQVTSPFGALADGSVVTAHTLSASPEGLRLTVLDLGATVARLRMPVHGGGFADVVLGLRSAADYASADNPYLGATVGRYANRIAGARFTLDGTAHELAANEGTTCLHGGPGGFHARRWAVVAGDEASLELELVSPDGDQGFPGRVTARCRYSVTDDAVTIEHRATTDAPTVVSLTNHAYVNLAGSGSVDEHRLTVAADDYLPVDPASIPLGWAEPVQDSPFDFRSGAELGAPGALAAPPGAPGRRHRPRLRAAGRRAAGGSPARAPGDGAFPRGLHHPVVGAGLHRQQARRHAARPRGCVRWGRAAASPWSARATPTPRTSRPSPRPCCARVRSTTPPRCGGSPGPRVRSVEPAPDRRTPRPESRWADLDGPVHYLDFGGPADGPLVVCVHGLGGSAVNWAAVAPTAGADLPGRGHRPGRVRAHPGRLAVDVGAGEQPAAAPLPRRGGRNARDPRSATRWAG